MTSAPLEEAAVAAAVSRAGLAFRGGFELLPAEKVQFSPFKAIALIGMTEPRHFRAFTAAPEYCDGLPDPLDRWSRRVIESLARQFDAKALFPFDGPPYLPFQSWARRAEECFPSPIGLFIHPDYGLWHSFRGALAIADKISSAAVRKKAGESVRAVRGPPVPFRVSRRRLHAGRLRRESLRHMAAERSGARLP